MNFCTVRAFFVSLSGTLLASWLSMGAAHVSAQPPAPSSFCISVNNDGFIALSWSPPANPDPFLNYEIHRDTGTGSQIIATVGPPTASSYVDFTANANQQNTYFIRSVVNGVTSVPTPSLRNAVLNLNASMLGVPQLSWNSPFTGSVPTGNVSIFRSIAGAPYELFAIMPITATNRNDTLYGQCDEITVAYMVRYDTDVCQMQSTVRQNEFRDNLAPPRPVIETVTVDENDNVITYWNAVNVPDLNFYRVQKIDVIQQQFINIGTIPAGQPTQFTYTEANPNQSTTIGVIAFDQCGNEASFGTAVTTMFLEASYTECDLNVLLSWSPYEGWQQGVQKYVIYASIDGGAPVEIAEMGFQSLFYLAQVEPNRDYCFWVEARAVFTQRPSTTNRACVNTNYPSIAQYNYLSKVSTLSESELLVALYQDPDAQGSTYELFRRRQQGNFLKIASYPQTTANAIEHIDGGLDTRNVRYFYQWRAIDGCGAPISQSNVSSNVVLNVVADNRQLINYLGWNGYEGWDGDVLAYHLYRKVGNEGFELLATLQPWENTYDDPVEQFMNAAGEFCYYIEAVEGNNAYGFSAESQSNTECVSQQPLVWIPNTLVINGAPENRIFKPVMSFVDFDSYRMEIYNRWGEKLFFTTNVEEGWDGHYLGNPVREDMYHYLISFRDGSGKLYVERAALFVLKR
jgi:gliding motility-associated-like protein